MNQAGCIMRLRHPFFVLAAVISCAGPPTPARAAPDDGLPPLHAVLIAPPTNRAGRVGAIADVKDVEVALRAAGAEIIARLTGQEASPAAVRKSLEEMRATVAPGTPALILYSGDGATNAAGERVLRLAGPAAGDMELQELEGLALQIEDAGSRMILALDTCFGGGDMRDIDVRAAAFAFRCEQSPPATPARDAPLTLRLSAAKAGFRVPEVVMTDGLRRGALSVALARGLGGGADLNGDHLITVQELRSYTTDLAYQLSDQRQLPESTARNPDAPIARAPTTRGFVVRPAGALAGGDLPAAASPGIKIDVVATAPRIKITALNSSSVALKEVAPSARAEVVDTIDGADLVWDASRREVLVGGDVIAQKVDRSDIPGVVERVAAGRALKDRAMAAPLPVRVTPAEGRNRRGSTVAVQVESVADRNMILLNVTGTGGVRVLYPVRSEPLRIRQPSFRMSYRVEPPFGADLFVAMASAQDLAPLRTALDAVAGEAAAKRAMEAIASLAPSDLRVGAANVYTTP